MLVFDTVFIIGLLIIILMLVMSINEKLDR
jgi:hypothetical protein